ncbi:hypothetical protein WNZ14_19515 [Hoeflea sp. AS60]|uniref:hypothetical protein n=1 Tax=Hoeflea sp. AS60 TaxID=3135780 RepID=UPI00317B0E9F
MIPEDDFLLNKPARRESVTALRIALMALLGCLILLAVLVIQARAEPDAMLDRQLREMRQHELLQPAVVQPTVGPQATS